MHQGSRSERPLATLSIRVASFEGSKPAAAAVYRPASSFDLRKDTGRDTASAGYRHQGLMRFRVHGWSHVGGGARDHRQAPLIHFTKQFR